LRLVSIAAMANFFGIVFSIVPRIVSSRIRLQVPHFVRDDKGVEFRDIIRDSIRNPKKKGPHRCGPLLTIIRNSSQPEVCAAGGLKQRAEKECLLRGSLTSAAEAVDGNKIVFAAVNRCATQSPSQNRVVRRSVEPASLLALGGTAERPCPS
jgi:hypothetical protein